MGVPKLDPDPPPPAGGVALPDEEGGPGGLLLGKPLSAMLAIVTDAADGSKGGKPGGSNVDVGGKPGIPPAAAFLRWDNGEVKYSLLNASNPAKPIGKGCSLIGERDRSLPLPLLSPELAFNSLSMFSLSSLS